MKNIYLTLVSTLLLLPTYATAGLSGGLTNGNVGTTTATIPEPSIIALLGVGVAAVFLIKKFKK